MSNNKKKIGLALGGGGARGLAHIGVIKALEEAGVTPDYISGTSMGAVVGGWYAAFGEVETLEEAFLNIKEKDILSVREIIKEKGGSPFRESSDVQRLEKSLGEIDIEKCKIPFRAISTDVRTGEMAVLKSGNLLDAIRASSAIPAVFPPVEQSKRLLMDGVFVDPVPADIVREMGADFVVAIDVSSKWHDFSKIAEKIRHPSDLIPEIVSSLEFQIARRVLEGADIVIRPLVIKFKWLDFYHAREIINVGYGEGRVHSGKISRLALKNVIPKSTFEKFMDFLLYKDEA